MNTIGKAICSEVVDSFGDDLETALQEARSFTDSVINEIGEIRQRDIHRVGIHVVQGVEELLDELTRTPQGVVAA